MTPSAMLKIAITPPDFLPDEADSIAMLLRGDAFWRVHVRKPGATADAMRRLLVSLPSWCLPRIVLHDHHELCGEFAVGGIHLNRRQPTVSDDLRHLSLTVSCSCHSIEEVASRKASVDYLFLSPIFDSISKAGYKSNFTIDGLRAAADAGIIDSRVFALGGVTPDRLPLLQSIGFGGAAMLGAVWGG